MARKRVFPTPKDMEERWEAYKRICDSHTKQIASISRKDGEIVRAEVPAPITYTLKGFCLHEGLSEQAFNETYEKDKRYLESITRMREECEVDARTKFETGELDPKLAPLWMGNYGYSSRSKAEVDARMENEKLSDIMDQLGGEGLEE